MITTDRQEAVIKQGNEIPYQTVSESGTETQFRDVVLELKVLPQITPDGRLAPEVRTRAVLSATLFAAGVITVFMALGAAASTAGASTPQNR